MGSRAYALRQHMLNSHTPLEAVGTVAETCGVKTLVLNHLVPGVMPVSHLQQACNGFSGRLIVGRDLMQVDVAT